MWIEILEWAAFGSAAVAVYMYGVSMKIGAPLGVLSATTFIFWGYVVDSNAGMAVNTFFFLLHANNTRKAFSS